MWDTHSLRRWNCSKLWWFYSCNLYFVCWHVGRFQNCSYDIRFVEQVTCASNRKALSNSHIPLCLHTLLLSRPKTHWARSLANACTRLVGLMCDVFVILLSTRVDTKTWMLWGRPQNEPCTSNFPIYTRWVVCGTSMSPDSDENDLESSYIFFRILLKWGYWNKKDDPAFQLLGSMLYL